MNSFYNTVSRGRLSSLNYEGIGPNYDAYLVSQSMKTINGQPFVTNIQDQVTNPNQMFSAGNMRGIMTYMQCANNVMCYTLTANAKYNEEFAKAQEIAKHEQTNGFLPIKSGGIITQPASIVSGAFAAVDQLGTQMIMGAKGGTIEQNVGATAEILSGAGISIAARTFNYATANDAGKAAVVAANNRFPFSLSYSSASGIGVSR